MIDTDKVQVGDQRISFEEADRMCRMSAPHYPERERETTEDVFSFVRKHSNDTPRRHT